MENKHKMAITGSGLVLADVGLAIVGSALMAPALFAWATELIEKRADSLASKVAEASKTVGKVAGALHRSFSEAKKAGVSEMIRSH